MQAMTLEARCPVCGHEGCKVREQFTQATRYERMRSLGWQGYCRSCQVAFTVDEPQLCYDLSALTT